MHLKTNWISGNSHWLQMGKDANNVVLYLNIFDMLGLFSGDQNQHRRHTEATLVRNEMVERFNVLYKASQGDATSNTQF